jgi:hypothetical protein
MKVLKCLTIFLIMALAAYPILELTRIIVVNGWTLWPEMKGLFWLEIILMWILYLSIPAIYLVTERTLRRINTCHRE